MDHTLSTIVMKLSYIASYLQLIIKSPVEEGLALL